ncbi:MAG: hypothetical protein ACLQQ4_02410 [Bacteroidia bacterium]
MGILSKKTSQKEDVISEANSEQKGIKLMSKPSICAVDINEPLVDALSKKGFQIFKGTIGSEMKVPKTASGNYHYVELESSLPYI